MKKAVKGALAVAGVATGALLGTCELIYEGVLSRKLIEFISENNIFGDGSTTGIYHNDEANKSNKWFVETSPSPAVIVDNDGEEYYAYIAKQKEFTHNWAVCVHGYSAGPKGVAHFGRHYYENGYNVIFPCMRAHSLDKHKYCSMGYYDRYIVCKWLDKLVEEDPDAKILVHGVSMGAATTMLVTGEDIPKNVVCAIADCGYTTCWNEYEAQIGEMLHLPVFPFLPILNKISVIRGNFDFKKCSPIKAVSVSRTPTLFIHGEKDTFVPYSMMDELFDACTADKDKLSVPDATHAVSSLVHPEMYWEKVDTFKEKYFESEAVTK